MKSKYDFIGVSTK